MWVRDRLHLSFLDCSHKAKQPEGYIFPTVDLHILRLQNVIPYNKLNMAPCSCFCMGKWCGREGWRLSLLCCTPELNWTPVCLVLQYHICLQKGLTLVQAKSQVMCSLSLNLPQSDLNSYLLPVGWFRTLISSCVAGGHFWVLGWKFVSAVFPHIPDVLIINVSPWRGESVIPFESFHNQTRFRKCAF